VTVYKNLTPTTNFTQDKTSGLIPLIVTFTANQVGAIKNDIWSWDFGDGTSTPNPHTYSTGNTYTVILTATNYTLGQTTFTNLTKACPLPTPTWFNYNWLYRKNITIDKTKVAATLTDFPVLINYTDTDLIFPKAQANGNDILFTKADGTTKLSHQIESFTSGTGALVTWVKIPSPGLSSAANTSIYMYYGNSSVSSQENPTDVWTANYLGVYHLNESTGSDPRDSTSNARHGIQSSSPPQMAGQIDGSLQFDGTADRVKMGNAFDFGSNPFTASAWVKGGGENQQVLGKSNWAGNENGIQIYTNSSAYVTAPKSSVGLTATGSTGYPSLAAGTTSVTGLVDTSRRYYFHWYRQTGTIKGIVTGIAVNIGVSNGNINVSLYNHNAGTGKPNYKLLESASVPSPGTGWRTISISPTYVDVTDWWIGIQHSATTANFKYKTNTPNGAANWYANLSTGGVYAAFPADGSGSALCTSGCANVFGAYVIYVQVMGYAKATKATLSDNNAVIESVSFYSHSTGNVRLAIYSDSSGVPNSKQWESGSTALTTTSWNKIGIASGTPSSLTLNSGTYWLAFQWDNTNYVPSFISGGSNGDGYNMTMAYGSFPSSWTGTSTKEKWSMFANYSLKIGPYDSNWHYLTVVRAGIGANQLNTYYDGNLVATGTDSRTLTNTRNFYLARANESQNYFNGYIDEVRLSSVVRDASWISTEYQNQANPALFHYNMTQETLGTC
jgi:hypothetical protein